MTAPDPALTARAETAYPGLAHEIQIARAAFIAGALSEREAVQAGGDETLAAIQKRAHEYAIRYPWRLKSGAKDYLPRDRAYLLAEIARLRMALEEAQKR